MPEPKWANEFIFAIQYRAHAKVMDHRGEWAEAIATELGVEHFGIFQNHLVAVDSFDDKESKVRAHIGFKQLGIQVRDVENVKEFGDWVLKYMTFVIDKCEFGDDFPIDRIGVRLRSCTQTDQSFDSLRDSIAAKWTFSANPNQLWRDKDVALEDIGFVVHFKDKIGHFKVICGPMNNEQLNQEYFQHKKPEELPEVAIYADIDYFQRPKKQKLPRGSVIPVAESYVIACWKRQEAIKEFLGSNR